MAWLFSKALLDSVSSPSSLVPAVASSAVICSDGEPSAPSSSTPTPQAYLWPDRTTGAWRRFPSGMTCERLTADRGEAVLMSFLAGFRARTSASRGRERGLTASALVCGRSSLESLARFDRASSSWKTPQLSLVAGLDEFSETWPRWGMMRDGACWELPTPARRTFESESGLWPTPTKDDASGRVSIRKPNQMQMLRRDPRLSLPTPTKGQEPGHLNPTWVEWLMGWPLEWTGLAPLETDKFQQWRRSHSELFANDCEAG